MGWLDVVILVWLAASLVSGLRMGFIYKVATIVGYFFGLWLASRYSAVLAEKWHLGPLQMPTVFFLILSTTSKIFGIAGFLFNKAFHLVARIPFIQTFNRVLGGALSVLLTMFIISSVLFIAQQYSPTNSISSTIAKSPLASGLVRLSVFYKPLLSEKLDALIEKQKTSVPTIPSADIPPK